MISFDPTAIQRNIYTILKTKVRREERLQNMENTFVNSQSLKELEIGIIDNVLTTGVANCLRRNSTLATPTIYNMKNPRDQISQNV